MDGGGILDMNDRLNNLTPAARLAGPPPAQKLAHMGENRVVFVGDFSVMDGEGNGRQYSHTVTDRKGWAWRLVMVPNGDGAENEGSLSVFVEHVNRDHFKDQEPGYAREMRLGFALLPKDQSLVCTSDSLCRQPLQHSFNYENGACGYARCWPRATVLDEVGRKKYICNGFIRISTFIEDVAGSKVPLSHNSKEETGVVGLKNQGATCYLNSLLQTFYHLRPLRQAVFNVPAKEDDSVALALQRVFYRLHTSKNSVGTRELTKSFGWDKNDSFTQQDVHELHRVLCERLKGTSVGFTIQSLFRGSIRSYIKCMDVDVTSAKVESFFDIQLDVKGCKNIHESFTKYVKEEVLDRENMYDAGEEHGRQAATKRVSFLRFPPVLNVHLKRFEYKRTTKSMVKVNDRFSFATKMDIDQYLEEAERDPQRPNRYILHSVLVHSGDVHEGHYLAYIRPDVTEGPWYKFNDEVVTHVEESEAIEGSYGGGPEVLEQFRDTQTFFPRDSESEGSGGGSKGCPVGGGNTSAYMLVYVRECDLPERRPGLVNTEDSVIQQLRDRYMDEEEDEEEGVEGLSEEEEEEVEEEICGICREDIPGPGRGITNCGHAYCFTCILTWARKQATCPECRSSVINITKFLSAKDLEKERARQQSASKKAETKQQFKSKKKKAARVKNPVAKVWTKKIRLRPKKTKKAKVTNIQAFFYRRQTTFAQRAASLLAEQQATLQAAQQAAAAAAEAQGEAERVLAQARQNAANRARAEQQGELRSIDG